MQWSQVAVDDSSIARVTRAVVGTVFDSFMQGERSYIPHYLEHVINNICTVRVYAKENTAGHTH